MKDKLIQRFLHSNVSHVIETEHEYDQLIYDPEFVARTTSNLVEITTVLNQMLQIFKEFKEICSDTKCQNSSETNIIENTIESTDDNNSSVPYRGVFSPPCDPLPLTIDSSPSRFKIKIPKISHGSHASLFDFISNMTIRLVFNEVDLFTQRGVSKPLVLRLMSFIQRK